MSFESSWLEWKPNRAEDARFTRSERSELTKPTEPPAEGVSSVLAVGFASDPENRHREAPPPPGAPPLPPAPAPGDGAVRLAPVPGTPRAELETDWRAALARARAGFAQHGGLPGGRDAERFVHEAATLEVLLRTREREFAAWRERWNAVLTGVYAGRVALLPGLAGELLATWRSDPGAAR